MRSFTKSSRRLPELPVAGWPRHQVRLACKLVGSINCCFNFFRLGEAQNGEAVRPAIWCPDTIMVLRDRTGLLSWCLGIPQA